MNYKMEIGNYLCNWCYAGFTFASVVLYEKKMVRGWFGKMKLKLIRIKYDPANSKNAIEAERITPDDLRRWYQSAIFEYEKYRDAWAAENAK